MIFPGSISLRPAALVVAASLLAAGCPRSATDICAGTVVQIRRQDTLTAGVDLAYPPFAFDDPDTGEPTGFEVDLLTLVAKSMGLKLLLVSRTTAALIPGALARRHDIAASALRDTDEFAKQACLSTPFLDADLGIVTSARNPRGIGGEGDLPGRVVGVVDGSGAETWAMEHLGQSPALRVYSAPEDVITDLIAGNIDAAVEDLPIAMHRQTQTDVTEVVHIIDTDSRYVFAAAPDNGPLMKLVNDGIGELSRSGKLGDLSKKWFGAVL